MRAGLRVLVMVAVASVVLISQDCPPIQFRGSTLARVYHRTSPREVGGLVRTANGTHTEYRYQAFSPWTKRAENPGIDQTLGACGGFPVPMGSALPTISLADPVLGSAANPVLVSDLRRNGTFSAIFVSSVISRNNLVVDSTTSDRTHMERKTYPTGTNPISLVLGDFNRDGRLDAAVLYGGADFRTQSGVSLLLGQNDGQFGAATNVTLGVQPAIAGFTTADLNGDGNLDLALIDQGKSSVVVLKGNGDGTFAAAVEHPGLASASALMAADVNKDGRADLLVAGEIGNTPRVAVLLSRAGGGFDKQPDQSLPQTASGITAAHFNADGHLDLATSNLQSGGIHILMGNGAGGFTYTRSYQGAKDQTNLMTTDYNLDGFVDIVAGGGHPEAITRGDLNEEAAILFGRGDGTFQAASAYPLPDAPAGAAVADFNGDGRADVALAQPFRPNLSILIRTPDGDFTPSSASTALDSDDHRGAPAVVAGDFDRDGRQDLIVPKRGHPSAAFLRGLGNGAFQSAIRIVTCMDPRGAATADLNGDVIPDLLLACPGISSPSERGLGILLGTGNGAFQPITYLGTPREPVSVAVADVNGDGRADAVLGWGALDSQGNSNGGVLVSPGKGDGTFLPVTEYDLGIIAKAVTTSDLNGDGAADVLWAGAAAGFTFRIGILMSGAAGTLTPSSMPTDFGPASIAVADFNGDGSKDLIVAHCCGDTNLTFRLGTGGSVFQPQFHFTAGATPGLAIPMDLDGDPRIDLLVAAGNSGPSSLFPLLNASPPSLPLLTSVSAASFLGERVAPESLVSAFGAKLANASAFATAIPLPDTLAGSSLEIIDANGTSHRPGLLFVNQTQMNFLMPRTLAPGLATATVTAADGTKTRGYLNVQTVAPALFTFNSDGLVAGSIIRVKPGGAQTEEPLFQQTQPGVIVAKPIDLGPAGDEVFLVIYGTGIRRRFSLQAVTATVGGETVPVEFAGPQGQFEGLDQVNLRLPRALAGKGKVEIRLKVDGSVEAAPVNITVQ